MKVQVHMLLTATREFTPEEVAELYPTTLASLAVGGEGNDLAERVRIEETASMRADPVEYVQVLLIQGAVPRIKVLVEE